MSKREATAPGGASSRGARAVAVAATAVALAVGACGGDQPARDEPPATPSQTAAEPSASDDGGSAGGGAPDAATRDGATGGADGGGTDDPDANAGTSAGERAGTGACVFEAPPGRLAEDTVAIDRSGASCEEGRRLAKAAALGQPAGANLELSSGGFRCVPSTTTKGANVTYTCSRGADAVSFEVLWTAP